VTAAFAIDTYTVTPSAGSHGSINPSAQQTANYNDVLSFTVTPDTGYQIDKVTGCGGSLNNTTYTTGQITADCTVAASFTPNTYTISAVAGEGGTISPSTVKVIQGNTSQFTVTHITGYHITSVTVCNGSLSEYKYTTGQITGDCAVTVSFAINTYTVTPSAGDHGTISPLTPQTVNYNDTVSFIINSEAGYHIASVSGCGGTPFNSSINKKATSLSENTYTTGKITGDCTVNVTFAIDMYTVTPVAGSHGSISPSSPLTLTHHDTATFIITPDDHYHIASVSGCEGTLTGNSYTTKPVTESCTVTAAFAIDSFTSTISVSGQGTISADGLSCDGNTCTGSY
jgi:hypothetical protein